MRSLARNAGLTERYVGNDLNFEKLCQDIPLSWAEQRERLGFSGANTHGQRTSLNVVALLPS